MRTCKQCDSEMVNGFDIKVDGASYGIKITKNSNGTALLEEIFLTFITNKITIKTIKAIHVPDAILWAKP